VSTMLRLLPKRSRSDDSGRGHGLCWRPPFIPVSQPFPAGKLIKS
jgi:hypothetical protein